MCTVNKKIVTWTIDDKEFINKIKNSLINDKHEIAGALLFTNVNCKDGICDKKSNDFKMVKGNGSSVYTPEGAVNFHTHPNHAYSGENAKYGWPSGEDMAQCIRFAKSGTLVHVVFTLEGAYVIKVNKILHESDTKLVESLFQETHIFRSKNQALQLKNFKTASGLSGSTTVKIWLKLANGVTLEKLYKSNGKNNKGNKEPIFSVTLVPLNSKIKFSANFISEKCHRKSFGEKSY